MKAGSSNFRVVPTLDTSAYASGDLLFNAIELSNVVDGSFGPSAATADLKTLTIVDKSGQAGAMDLLFFKEPPASGSLNAAAAITDAEAESIALAVSLVASDWVSYGNGSVTTAQLDVKLRATPGKTSLWLVGISKDTKTYAANALVVIGELDRVP